MLAKFSLCSLVLCMGKTFTSHEMERWLSALVVSARALYFLGVLLKLMKR